MNRNDEEMFWVVWNPHGGNPRVRHSSQASAVAEARRLARENKGTAFFVLCANDMFVSDDVRHVRLEPGAPF